jgi:intracellular septation protein
MDADLVQRPSLGGISKAVSNMRFLIDFFPILLFFIAYKVQGIYIATAVLMAATLVQTALLMRIEGRLSAMQKTTVALILVFGGLTLFLQDERFIQWKPTVLYAAMAMALWGALLIWNRNVLHTLLGAQLKLPVNVWNRLTHIWAVYFLFMASINAYAVVMWSMDEWMNFKLWGYVFPVIFIVGQGLYIAPYLKSNSSER